MSASRMLGFVILLIAAGYLLVALLDIGPEYASVAQIVDNQEQLGLETSTTNLRFRIGLELLVDILCIGLLALVGWWLTTVETQQFTYLYVGGAIILASIVLRVTPLLPLEVARYSPGAFFFGVKVAGAATSDETANWVIIPPRETLRVATIAPPGKTQGGTAAILDFGIRKDLQQEYLSSYPPVPIQGMVSGTHNIASGNKLFALPRVKVQALGK